MKASLERRLRKIEDALASRKKQKGLELFFIPKNCEDVPAFKAQCRAATRRNRTPFFIEFVGPEGGPEEGTGPIETEETERSHHHDKAV